VTTVTKIKTLSGASKWLVEGDIYGYSNYGRVFDKEPYLRAFATKKAAEADAVELDKFNAFAIENHEAAVADRLYKVNAYLATRAARKTATPEQFSLFAA
jgi:hypothetical protein